ncbi:MAG: alpha/beta fold hydrolase [Povalibacter sp.]
MGYAAQRPPQHDQLTLRGLTFHLYRWPGTDPAPIVLLHGWGDTGETWQFVVDYLPPDRTCIAFDARGFGRTQWPADGYWFPDYLADLDALLDALSPDAPVDLVGHSMGGNVASMYAGIRSDRVRRLVNLEGLGLARTEAANAPERYRDWLDELREGTHFMSYDDYQQFAQVLARRNPRTSADRLEFIAQSWAYEKNGRIALRADPRHKRSNPILYQRDQLEACWRAITAPVLFVTGEHSEHVRRLGDDLSPVKLQSLFRTMTRINVAAAGHMLHHEQPRAVAELIAEFFR